MQHKHPATLDRKSELGQLKQGNIKVCITQTYHTRTFNPCIHQSTVYVSIPYCVRTCYHTVYVRVTIMCMYVLPYCVCTCYHTVYVRDTILCMYVLPYCVCTCYHNVYVRVTNTRLLRKLYVSTYSPFYKCTVTLNEPFAL